MFPAEANIQRVMGKRMKQHSRNQGYLDYCQYKPGRNIYNIHISASV